MSVKSPVSALKRVATGRKLRLLAVLLSAFALLFTGAPQVATAAGTVAGDGSGLRGTVSLADAGVSFITIVAYSVADGLEDWAMDLSVTSGDFEMPELAPGTYVLKFSSGGYRDQCYGGDTCSPIGVVDGEAAILEPVILQRMSPGTVKGKVVAGNGAPLAGVAIAATYDDNATGEHREAAAVTDAMGVWVLSDLPSGLSWQAEFSKAGLPTYHVWIYAEDGRTTTVGTVVLMAPGRVSGTVRDIGGSGVAGALVYLQPSSGGPSVHAETGPDGSYELPDVPPARYRLDVYAAGHPQTFFPGVQYEQDASVLTVKEGAAVSADVTLTVGITVSGRLLDSDGNPIGGTAVLSEKATGATTEDWVAADGTYTFTDLWPGTFTVKASATGHIDTWLGDKADEDGATWRELASGDTSEGNDITLPTRPVHVVSGTVSDTAGNPAGQLTVRLGDYEALPTDADGHFSVVVEDAGTHDVAINAGAGLVCGGDAHACPVASVTVPAVGDVEVALRVPLLGSLAGAITVPEGMSVDWGDLSLVNANGTTMADFTFEGSTDYFLAAVPQGVYSLEAYGDGFAPYRASVTVDGAVTRDILISDGFTVAGTITVPQQEGWVEAVAVDPATGNQLASYWVEGPVSGAVGYTLAHLAPGSYVIGAEAKSGGWTWYPGGSDTRGATPVAISTANVTGIDFSATTIANLVHVVGSVKLLGGGVIPADNDFTVSYRNQVTSKTYSMWTGALGAYQFDVPTGDYVVRVSASEELGTAPFSEQLEVTAPLSHDITVVPGGTLVGRLVDGDGLAVDGRVWATQAGVTMGDARADGWGFWSVGSLPAGEVELHAAAADFTDAALGTFAITPGVTTDVGAKVLTAAGRLPVRLPEVGDANISVVITDQAGATLTSEKASPGEIFWISPVPAGKVLVRFEGRAIKTEWWRDAATAGDATPVTIVAGAAAALIAPKLAAADPVPDGTVSGTITNSTGRFGQRYVTVVGGGVKQTSPVKADGTWSEDVPPGTYRVRAGLCVGYWLGDSGCLGERITTWYPGVVYAEAQTVTVTSGATTSGIEIDLGATLSFTTAPVPTITGKAMPGASLTAVAGTWTPAPDHLGYQWSRAGAPIAGATSDTYAVTDDDLGATITVAVTGTKSGFKDATRTSEATSSVVGAITPGTVGVSGAAAVGARLTAVVGPWAPGGVLLGYQWLRDGAAISAATSAVYTVQVADAGSTLAVRVTGSKAGFTDAAATSTAVTVPLLQFTATPVPTITGTAKLGATLTAVPGTWEPGTVSLAYRWLRDGAEIGGATSSTHVVVGTDAGKAIAVRVTGSAPGYASVSKTSAVTAKVPSGKMATKAPTISGTLKVGRILTAKVSGWKPGETTFTYTWYRSGKTIKGAIAGTYALVAADLGKTMKVKVTGTAVGYPSASATSKSTKKVARGTIVAGKTVIAAAPRVGQQLAIDTADWQPAGLKFSYQWYRSGKAISKAKAAGYTVTTADLARLLTVKVTASRSGYTTASKTSKATAAVVA